MTPFAIFLFILNSAKFIHMLPKAKQIEPECSTTSQIREQNQTINLLFYFWSFQTEKLGVHENNSKMVILNLKSAKLFQKLLTPENNKARMLYNI